MVGEIEGCPYLEGGNEVLQAGPVPHARHARRTIASLAQQPQQLGLEPGPYPSLFVKATPLVLAGPFHGLHPLSPTFGARLEHGLHNIIFLALEHL